MRILKHGNTQREGADQLKYWFCYVLKIGLCRAFGNRYFMRMAYMGKLMKKYCNVVSNPPKLSKASMKFTARPINVY